MEFIRKQFPILSSKVGNNSLIYFDNAATTQKPLYVIKSLLDYYTKANANVHRGFYNLSNYSSHLYDNSRRIVAEFINATEKEVFFAKNSTEGLNQIAIMLSKSTFFKKGDVIVLSESDHHSNILPWMRLAKEKNLHIEWIGIDENYRYDTLKLENIVVKYSDKIKLVSVTHVSNVLGVENDLLSIKKLLKQTSALFIVDAAQSIAHTKIDVQKINCDFLVFSGHKVYSPMGVGVVFGKYEVLQSLEPALVGGGIVTNVEKNGADWEDIPIRFEAGTPNVADTIGLAAGILWFEKLLKTFGKNDNVKNNDAELSNLANIDEINPLTDIDSYLKLEELHIINKGWHKFEEVEKINMKLLFDELINIEDIKILGSTNYIDHLGVISLYHKKIHAHDISSLLDESGIAVRSGMHCAHLLHKANNVNSTFRVSLGIYNTQYEIEKLILALKSINKYF